MICAGCGTILDPNRDAQPPVLAASAQTGLHATSAYNQSPQQAPSRYSVLAIVSMIAGFLSPLFIIACLLSIFTSTVAIVTGHIALYKINRSAQQLEGRVLAIIGLVFGYLSMGLSIAVLIFLLTRPPSNANGDSLANITNTPKGRLDSAELSVMSGSNGEIGHGNNALAKEIATKFAREMKRADEMVFKSNRKPGIQLSGGEYLTHCEIHEGTCAFIVHVPSYRHFTKDAEEALQEIAWITASDAVKDHLREGDSIAIGLRGSLTYGDILFGKFTSDKQSYDYRLGSAKELIPFFEGKEPQTSNPFGLPTDSAADAFAAAKEPSPFETPAVERSPFEQPSANAATSAKVPQAESLAMNASPPIAADNLSSPAATVPATPKSESLEPELPKAEQPKPEKPKPAKPKRELPKFENKIPTSLISSIDAQGWGIESMIFVQDGRRLVSGGMDHTISVFDIQSGEMLFRSPRLDDLGQIISLTLSKDGKMFFAGGYSGRVASFELKDDGKVELIKPLFKHNREAGCIVASPKFPFVLSGGEDGTVTWQPFDERSSSIKTVQVLKRKILAAHLFNDRNEGIATDGETMIHFSLKDGKVLKKFELSRSYPQRGAISRDGSKCAVSYGSEIGLFESATGTRIAGSFDSKEMVWSVMFHPTKPWLITGGAGKATIWSLDSKERLADLDMASTQYAKNLAITPDGSRIALIASSAGQSFKVFDLTK